MEELILDTPFEDFQERWLEEIDQEFVKWAQEAAEWLADKTAHNRKGFKAPSVQQMLKLDMLMPVLKSGNNIDNIIKIATIIGHYRKPTSVFETRFVPLMAWIEIITKANKPQSYNVVEAVYCFYYAV